jgi:tRNA (adenine37-N6)-methyltransferase
MSLPAAPITITPIGIAHTPHKDKLDAPRQAEVAKGTRGVVELYPSTGMQDALEGIEVWERIWLIFQFDRDSAFRPKVTPPRSSEKLGVLATRSPHRPNPIGLSCVKLVGVRGLYLDVEDLDLLDGTPILDIKPYVPYADAFVDAGSGWLAAPQDPKPDYQVQFAPFAETQCAWLAEHGETLRDSIGYALALGPYPHAYRRITKGPKNTSRIGFREWRAYFEVTEQARSIAVARIESGFRPQALATGEVPDLHRAFCERFGMPRGFDA